MLPKLSFEIPFSIEIQNIRKLIQNATKEAALKLFFKKTKKVLYTTIARETHSKFVQKNTIAKITIAKFETTLFSR